MHVPHHHPPPSTLFISLTPCFILHAMQIRHRLVVVEFVSIQVSYELPSHIYSMSGSLYEKENYDGSIVLNKSFIFQMI